MNQSEQFRLKVGLAEMLKGGVIMDVMNAEQAVIAQEAGAAAVMALERIPSQIRKDGGVARMSDPDMIQRIQSSVDIPVMAKCRIGHVVEAQILEALEVDFIDECEVLTPADEEHHVWKHEFKVPFVCGCRDLGEALRRVGEGAAMIRTKGEAGTGNVVEAVRHMRAVQKHLKQLTTLREDELMAEAKQLGAPFELVAAGRAHRQAARAQFRCGGRGDARGRRADDAARGRGRVRGLGHLRREPGGQGRGRAPQGPVAHGQGNRPGGRELAAPGSAQGDQHRTAAGHARDLARDAGRGGAACPARLVIVR